MSTEYDLFVETGLVGRIQGSVAPADTSISARFTELDPTVARTPDANTKHFVIDYGGKNWELVRCTSHSTSSGVTTLTGCVRWLNKKGTSLATSGSTGATHYNGTRIASVPNHLVTNLLWDIWKNNTLTGGYGLNLGKGDYETGTIYVDGVGFVRHYRAAAYMRTNAEGNDGDFSGYPADGQFGITIDGDAYNVEVDLSGAADADAAAALIQTAIRALTGGNETATYAYTIGIGWRLTITSDNSGDTSAVSALTAGSGGTDISGASYLNGLTGQATVTALVKKAQFSNDGSSWTNLDNAGAHGSSASLADHGDVDLTGLASGDIIRYDGSNWVPLSLAEALGDAAEASYSYAEDAEANDSYAITLSPAPSALVDGREYRFKANTANTGAATLNINSLGAKTIKKNNDQDLETGDIEAAQIVSVVYNADDDVFEWMGSSAGGLTLAQIATLTGGGNADSTHTHAALGAPAILNTTRQVNATSGTQTIAHGLGRTPIHIEILVGNTTGNLSFSSIGHSDLAGNDDCIGFGNSGYSSSTFKSGKHAASAHIEAYTGVSDYDIQEAIATADSTNITLTWTRTRGGTGGGGTNMDIVIKAI